MSIKIPTPKKRALKEPPSPNQPKITNLKKRGSKEFVTMNLRVRAEFRRQIKLYATKKDMSIVDVVKQSFLEFKERNI